MATSHSASQCMQFILVRDKAHVRHTCWLLCQEREREGSRHEWTAIKADIELVCDPSFPVCSPMYLFPQCLQKLIFISKKVPSSFFPNCVLATPSSLWPWCHFIFLLPKRRCREKKKEWNAPNVIVVEVKSVHPCPEVGKGADGVRVRFQRLRH